MTISFGPTCRKWGELEQHEPELFRARLDEATAERNKAQEMAADEGVKPLLGGDELDKARAEGGSLGGRPKTQEMAPEEGVRPIGGQGENLGHQITKVMKDRGTASEYLVRRLKRDAPQIAEALGRGEYKSARAAGIAAGIVRVPTPLQIILRLLPRLDAADRALLSHELAGAERAKVR